jgi:hypothetical protein
MNRMEWEGRRGLFVLGKARMKAAQGRGQGQLASWEQTPIFPFPPLQFHMVSCDPSFRQNLKASGIQQKPYGTLRPCI